MLMVEFLSLRGEGEVNPCWKRLPCWRYPILF